MGARLVRRLGASAPPALLAGLLSACGGADYHPLVGTDLAPGTDGTLQVEQIEGGNSLVTISLSGLPPPGRIAEDATTYVVWIEADGGASRAGVLSYDEEVRTGRMMATTPLTHFTVTITAEREARVTSPGPAVVVQRELSAE